MYLLFYLLNFILYIILLHIWHIYTIHEKTFLYTGVVIFFHKFFYIKTFPLVFTKLTWEKPDTWAFFFFECLGTQFFNSLTCDLRDTMPCQRSLTLLPREAEDFPRGDMHFKYVPALTYLIYLSPKELNVLGLFKRCGYLPMKYNVSYEIWSLFTIGYCASSSILYPLGHRALLSMYD